MIAAGARRAACRHHVERGEDSLAERLYRKTIFVLDTELRRWYKGDGCLKKRSWEEDGPTRPRQPLATKAGRSRGPGLRVAAQLQGG